MTALTGKQIINGQFKSSSAHSFTASNRLLSTPLEDRFYEATSSEIDEAAIAAWEAFQVYRKKSGAEKAEFLDTIAGEIMNLGDRLIEQANIESGLPVARLLGERDRTVNQLKMFAVLVRAGHWVAAVIDTAQRDRKPLPRADIRSMQMALGPAAVFGASNFPFAYSVAGGDTASALAAGCPVIFKAHPAHPGTCELVGRAIMTAIEVNELPYGIFSMVHGASHEVGMSLVQHKYIKAVGFTGSLKGGKALFDLASRRAEPIPVYAEMGSINPVFILPDVLAQKGEELSKGLAASITLGVGQFCTNPGMFVMEETEESRRFAVRTGESVTATPMQPMLTDEIQSSYKQGIGRLGTITGTASEDLSPSPQIFITKTETVLENEGLVEEVFGPCSVAVMAETKEALLDFATNLKGQLTATIHGTEADLIHYRELIDILTQKAGRVIINGFPTGVEVGHAMVHGGPFPATTDSRSTSVGTNAIYRFTRPVCFQEFPSFLLPPELWDENPLHILRKVNGEITDAATTFSG